MRLNNLLKKKKLFAVKKKTYSSDRSGVMKRVKGLTRYKENKQKPSRKDQLSEKSQLNKAIMSYGIRKADQDKSYHVVENQKDQSNNCQNKAAIVPVHEGLNCFCL